LTEQTFAGVYLNLDRSVERRAAVEAQLSERGLEFYERFAALDGASLPPAPRLKPGEVGCLYSHLEVLERAAKHTHPTHIVEDDVVFSRMFLADATRIVRSGALEHCDILFTDMFVQAHTHVIRTFLQALPDADGQLGSSKVYQLFDVRHFYVAGANSYFVSPGGARRVLDVFRQEIKEAPDLPYDFYLRTLASSGRLRMACVVPFLTSVRFEEPSTIGTRHLRSGTRALHALLRYTFYTDRELASVRPRMEELTASPRAEADANRAFVVQILDALIAQRGEGT
jgi:GR25 family glycosyltransferase involved in LPS biosynthesis